VNPLERWLLRTDRRLAHVFAVVGLFYLIIASVAVAALVLVNVIKG